MKTRAAQPRKNIPQINTVNQIASPKISNDGLPQKDRHKSLDQERLMSKTPGGNYNVFREILKNGGKGDDSRWIIGLRTTKPSLSKEKIQTVIQPFNFGQSKKANGEVKREVVQFKVNGQSGEFNHLINHRRVAGPNSSMLAFETALRSQEEKKDKKSKRLEDQAPKDSTANRPRFRSFPKKDRNLFPAFVVSPKEMEQRKKQHPFYLKEGIFQSTDEYPGKYIVSAQDGRENYPPYQLNERPDRRNIEPFSSLLGYSEIGPIKWTGDLRLSKSNKNHKLKPFMYRQQPKPSKESEKPQPTKTKK